MESSESSSDSGATSETDHDTTAIEKPPPPDSLPKYLVDPLMRQGVGTLKKVAEFVNELIEYHKEIQDRTLDDPPEVPDDSEAVIEDGQKVWYNTRLNSCNDSSCKCSSGNDEDLHGPYKYKYFRGEDGKMQSKYIGKVNQDDS